MSKFILLAFACLSLNEPAAFAVDDDSDLTAAQERLDTRKSQDEKSGNTKNQENDAEVQRIIDCLSGRRPKSAC